MGGDGDLRPPRRLSLELAKRAAVFDPERLRQAARRLPPLTRKKTAKGFAEARALMLEAGVTLVFVPEIKDTRISGVSRHVNGTPMIAVTSRYRYCDALWFTVLHEVAHLLLHPKRATFIDFGGKASDDDAQETAANAFAADLLVPPATRPRLIAASSVAEVTELAEELRVDPGILAGQRAHLTGDWGGQLARLRRREDLAAALA
ncbi:ImmA/IrrE family metallo-endopeptidase [Agrococcus citreus]|uniref:IrrE N-terminal-like domain-containing protein n=1 Tax=Agrococcus citreus TaxID=84643 RepID=A0ABN1YNX7_9MICO